MLKINVLGLSNLHPIRLSVAEVCNVCGFSERTFFHRVKAGRLKVTRSTTEFIRDGRPRLYVCADDLAYYFGIRDEAQARARMSLPAIVEEKPEPEPYDRKIFADAHVRDTRTPDVPPSKGNVRGIPPQGFTDDAAENLARWNAGEVTDSAGNNGQGSNDRFPTKGPQTLLGPREPRERVRPDTTVHMNPALIGELWTAPNPVDSDEYLELLHPGTAERKAQQYAQAGLRQPSEQDRKKHNDIAAIASAFRQGYSR